MSTKPIIFNAPMIRATLDGRKTQTRRVVTPQPADIYEPGGLVEARIVHASGDVEGFGEMLERCPYGRPGDLLWVRETWQAHKGFGTSVPPSRWEARPSIRYKAGGNDERIIAAWPSKWRPSIHMPRWASRLTLRITDVRVERLQEISEADARAEGAERATPIADGYLADPAGTYLGGFSALWDSINAGQGYGWDANPLVWALNFEVIRANVDEVLKREVAA